MKFILYILFLMLLGSSVIAQESKIVGENEFGFIRLPSPKLIYATELVKEGVIKEVLPLADEQRMADMLRLNAELANQSQIIFVKPSILKIDHSISSSAHATIISLPKVMSNVLLLDLSKSSPSSVPNLVTFTFQ